MRRIWLCWLPAIAFAQQPAHWPCVPGARIDPAYLRTAEDTGGQVLLLDRTEAASSFALVQSTLAGHRATVARASGMLADEQREFPVPVDSSIESITFSVFVACKAAVSILTPSGQPVTAPAGGRDTAFRSGRIVTVAHPAAGEWRMRAAGSGIFSAVAEARSAIDLVSVRIVERGGRPGHEGLFPVKRPPRADASEMLQATLGGPAGAVRFRMLHPDGAPMQWIDLTKGEDTGDPAEFTGSIVPPTGPFRIAAQGTDAEGLPFQRLYAPLFRPEP